MANPEFNWEQLRKSLQFYEKERLRYFPIIWGQKNGPVEWKPLQNRAPTFDELAEWFQENKPTNVAVICGGASNGLVVLCFNDPEGAGLFFGQKLWEKLLSTTFVVKTPRGPHVYLRSSTLIPSRIIGKDDNKSWLEIRADGNYIAAPPSLHPSGIIYEAIGVEEIAKPKNLPDFIEQRLAELGLKARLSEKAPEKTTQLEEYLQEKQSAKFNKIAVNKLLENCAFIQYCRDNAATLTEPYWWAMVHNLAIFGQVGEETVHELSEPHRKYTKEETNQKIKEAHKQRGQGKSPHLCENIGFTCPEDCQAKKLGAKSPAGLGYKLARAAGLPIIITSSRFLREKTMDTIAAVEQANKPPQIFKRGGYLARVNQDESGSPYIETLTESACRGFIDRSASFVRISDTGAMIPLPAPPLDVVRDYMNLPDLNLPPLIGVTETPVIRSDGSILSKPGYDEATCLYYQPPPGFVMPDVPEEPNEQQLSEAITLIQEPVLNFPFDSLASRTNAIAVMLTPVYRPMINGLVPLCLIDKPQPGTGAGLLSDVISIITTGRPAIMMAPPKSDEECEKRLGSILLSGQAVITIDNVEGRLYFPSLAMLLTADTFLTRILGQSKMVRLPNRCTYIVTGNNVTLAGDMPRRCYLCRMDARMARPWMRDPKSFKYKNLINWTKENRGQLLAAILTIARAWIVGGKTIPKGLPTVGSFEGWGNTMGGILSYAGFPDFLGNLDFMYSQSDSEIPQWENFLSAWQELLGGGALTTATIIQNINEHDVLSGALPDTINRDPKKVNRSLGTALAKRNGVRYPNGLMISKSKNTVHHAVAWQVETYQEKGEGELGESEKPDIDMEV